MASAVILVTVIVAGFLLHPSVAQLCNEVEGTVRLVNGSSRREGRVEICMNGLWGGVCRGYSSWSSNNVKVVCQQLGYPSSLSSSSADYGAGVIAWMSSSSCSGTESSLLECSHGGPTDSCYGDYFAGVLCPQCTAGSIWLEGGLVPTEGNVLVCVNGEFIGVCHSYYGEWGYKNAFVVCRQLGYPAIGAQYLNRAYYGGYIVSGEIDYVRCYGNESSLLNCQYRNSSCSIFYTVGVRCQGEVFGFSCIEGDVRLVDGEDEHEGRVEICSNGVWGTVRDSGWDSRDAIVVCRQLGYPTTNVKVYRNAYFGQGTGPVLFRYFCESSESSLQMCESDQSFYYYNHNYDAGVRCGHIQYDKTDCMEGSVRLAGGSNNTEGLIEICHNHTWGTICDEGWSTYDAEVLCYQLGFQTYGAVAYSGAHFGEGSGPYHYSSFGCNGSEESIFNCSHDDYYSCQPGEEAGVSCKVSVTLCNHGDVRLEGGYTDVEGRVEVCVNGQWGTVCDDNTDQSAFDLICRQYFNTNRGQNSLRTITTIAGCMLSNTNNSVFAAYSLYFYTFGIGGGRLMLENLECTGSESKLTDCQYTVSDFAGECLAYEDAGVRCYNNDSICSTHDVRLMDGRNEFEGRVEVCQSGIWGAVRDYSWDYYDAVVTCKQLGYPSNWAIPLHGSYFGRGSVPILTSYYNCYTNDQLLSDCYYGTYSFSWSGSENVAGVVCQGNTTTVPECTSGDIRLAGGSSEGVGRVEICIDGFWGTVCSNGFGTEEAVVICRQMGYPSTGVLVINGGSFGSGQGPIMGQLTCTGRESNIDQCVFGGVGAVDCHHGIDAALTCIAHTKLYYKVRASKLPEDPVEIGSQVALYCSVSSSASLGETTQYKWTSSIPNYSITNSASQNATVNIQSGHPTYGSYYCHVYNGSNQLGVGHVTIEVKGLLHAVTSKVFQFTPPETITLQVGVTDISQQYYFYELVWYHNGYELTLSDRMLLSENNTTLTITNTLEEFEDSGIYEVRYGRVHVKPHDYDRQCEEKVISTLRHYPLLQPVIFYANSGCGITTDGSPSVQFNASQSVVSFTELDNITLAIEGTADLPIDTDIVTTILTVNGQSVPSTVQFGTLKRQFSCIYQTIELKELNILNSGVLDAALVISSYTYFITTLGCPMQYYDLVGYIFSIDQIALSQSSIGIQYYEPPVMTLDAKKLDLKKGERSTLTCTATGGYPPVKNISFLKAGAVLVSTDSSSLSITVDSELEYGYGHYVCAANSAGVIREEEAKIQERDDMSMQLKFESGTSCANWNDGEKESKAMQFADSITLVAQALCSCDFSVDNMHYSSADCSGGGKTFTVRFTVTYSDENGSTLASTVMDMMEQWAVTGPTLAIDGIQATVSDFSCSTCSDSGKSTCPNHKNNNSGLIAGLLIGGIAIGCISVLIPIELLVIWKKITQRKSKTSNEQSAPPSTTKTASTTAQKAVSTNIHCTAAGAGSINLNLNADYELANANYEHMAPVDEAIYEAADF